MSASRAEIDVQLGMGRSVGKLALALAAALLGAGCLPMMVGSAAYQGYKYEHNKKQPTATSSSEPSKTPSTSPTQQKIPDSDIE